MNSVCTVTQSEHYSLSTSMHSKRSFRVRYSDKFSNEPLSFMCVSSPSQPTSFSLPNDVFLKSANYEARNDAVLLYLVVSFYLSGPVITPPQHFVRKQPKCMLIIITITHKFKLPAVFLSCVTYLNRGVFLCTSFSSLADIKSLIVFESHGRF